MIEEFFDKSPAGFFSFFDDGSLHFVNEMLCTLLDYQREELVGRNVEMLFTLPTRIFYQTHLFPLVKMHGHAEEIFVTLLAKDGRYLPVLLNAKRAETAAKPYTACAFIVVANRKKFEDELVAARNAAETALKENSELLKAKAELQLHAEQMDDHIQVIQKQNYELKQLNHVVTHNLKEPLRKILVYTERLQTGSSPESINKNKLKLNKASAQMRAIVSGMQQYVWLDDNTSQFTLVDLQELVTTVEEQLQKQSGGQLTLQMNMLPPIKADLQQIQLLFYHILSNAIQFKKEKMAYVNITASLIQQNRFRAIEKKYKYENFVKLEIRDEGIGFDPAYREDIFELFKKLHHTEGVGLGLALCKKIVENHFGIITANSKINEATTITVVLPVDQPI